MTPVNSVGNLYDEKMDLHRLHLSVYFILCLYLLL